MFALYLKIMERKEQFLQVIFGLFLCVRKKFLYAVFPLEDNQFLLRVPQVIDNFSKNEFCWSLNQLINKTVLYCLCIFILFYYSCSNIDSKIFRNCAIFIVIENIFSISSF